MPVIGLSLLIQIALIIHIVRTGREYYWIWLVFIPVVGPVVYVVTQILPDLMGNYRVRTTTRALGRAIDPHREVRRARDELAVADNVDNRLRLADACREANLLDEAEPLYRSCLTGPYADDPHILVKLAEVCYRCGRPADARLALERLIAANPDFRSLDGHLIYAKSLADLGEHEAALTEFESLSDAYPGEEARIRYALLLKEMGRTEAAVELFRQTVLRSKRAPGYYRQQQKEWIRIARENLAA